MSYSGTARKMGRSVVSTMLCGAIAISFVLPTQAQRPGTTGPARSLEPASQEDGYILGGGDRIRIDNAKLPQYSGEYVIPAGGSLSLPLVGSLSIGGLTMQQATNAINAAYGRILKRPQIGVRLLEPRPVIIAISGEVNRPGSYTIPVIGRETGIRYPTITQVIQQAEGTTPSADLRRIQVRRQQRSGSQVINVNLQSFLQAGTSGQDITLRDGDTIFIPTATNLTSAQANQLATASVATDLTKPRTVTVSGEVTNPGSYVLVGGNTIPDRNVGGRPTVTRSIQLAGGTTSASDLRRVQVRRRTKAGGEQLFNVNLWQLLQTGDSSQDLIVQEGDSIFIPTLTNMTPAQANQLATVSLATDIAKPRTVTVLGEITNPGSYVLVGGNTIPDRNIGGFPTVTRAIQLAGGTTSASDLRRVQVRRLTKAGGEQIFNLDLLQFFQTGNSNQDLIVQEGDSIFIPTLTNITSAQANQLATVSLATDLTKPRTVIVVGEVTSPGSYVLVGGNTVPDRNVGGRPTVTRAIQLAGGIRPTSDIRRIQVRRTTKAGGEQVFNVNLWEYLQTGDASQDLIVQEGDTIFIPTATEFNPVEANLLASVNFATDINTPRTVAVVGEVNRPGVYAIIGGITAEFDRKTGGLPTLTRAIERAGGITTLADLRNIELRRTSRGGTEQSINVNLWQFLQAGTFTQDLILQDGDTIFIPTATDLNPAEVSQLAASSFSPTTIQVSVVGEVVRPGRIEVSPDTTLNQAVLVAGGFNRSRAKRNSVELIRLNPNGTVTKRTVSINFNEGINEQTNPLLRDNDIIVIGRSGLARVTDTLDLPLGSGLSLFRIFDFLQIFR
ncbi:polysaccharide biosynthesis/export family protein [Argonema antarcticum]|uniref:polysaccharide biosynthesis/export family protein n=1 Tax=Argonema antarcticum TaxID=2942763 RepID=UPI00201363CC|nr:SLBB domain-containing protein [Argonema antarcticum]